jgi:anthranilate phosphoribosyltransferase
MSNEFRELLKKVGSGIHTKKDLTRAEAATAAKMLLKQEATPAQIGAFLISHRIKRPTGLELAGMLDTYDELGGKLASLTNKKYPLTVLGNPYDGRSRTAPISPITALILVTAGVPVLMHGGEKMPIKYGIPLIEIWQNLGLDFTKLSLNKVQNLLENKGLGFLYLPLHFPEAQSLVKYRDEIGKRPPLATLELIWIPYEGESHLIAGYVHPATEKMMRETFKLRGIKTYTLVKGLEGSCDLKRQQTNIIAINKTDNNDEFEYLKINAQNYGFSAKDVELSESNILFNQLENVLNGKDSELTSTAIFNGGFYLWRCGVCANIETGFKMTENMLKTQQVKNKLEEIKTFIETIK